MLLGAGRDRVDATVDPAAGIMLHRKPGDPVVKGEAIMDLHYNDDRRLGEAVRLAEASIEVGPEPPRPVPLVRAWIHAHGETSYA